MNQPDTNSIELVYHKLQREIDRRDFSEIEVKLCEDWVEIELIKEQRKFWIGHLTGSGYFMTWDQSEVPEHFFGLDDFPLDGVLALLPAENKGVASHTGALSFPTDDAQDLLDSISSDAPDPERISNILDDLAATDVGLNVVAMVATIKSCRSKLDELRRLIETQDEEKHTESVYQKLLASNPWLLGSHYEAVVDKEFTLWFDSRVDLLLRSALGYVDIVELKRPDTQLLVESGRPGVWRESSKLSDARAQAKKYIRAIDEHRYDIERQLKIRTQSSSRMYRSCVIIVAGRTPTDEEATNTLRDSNTSDGRLLLLTYDDLLAIGEATLAMFEHRLEPGHLRLS